MSTEKSVKQLKTYLANSTYVKDDSVVLSCFKFVYCTELYSYSDGTYFLLRKEYFSCESEIENIVSSYWIQPGLQFHCELYAAPKTWLLKNNYMLYVPTEKPKRIKKKKENESNNNVSK